MTIKNKYEFGDTFCFKNDPDQKEYTLTGLIISPGKIQLELSHCGDTVLAYEFEITVGQDEIKKLLS